MKSAVAGLAFSFAIFIAPASEARGGGGFGIGHPTKFNCPPRSRIERLLVRLDHACDPWPTAEVGSWAPRAGGKAGAPHSVAAAPGPSR
jgi:hypothetical protein